MLRADGGLQFSDGYLLSQGLAAERTSGDHHADDFDSDVRVQADFAAGRAERAVRSAEGPSGVAQRVRIEDLCVAAGDAARAATRLVCADVGCGALEAGWSRVPDADVKPCEVRRD